MFQERNGSELQRRSCGDLYVLALAIGTNELQYPGHIYLRKFLAGQSSSFSTGTTEPVILFGMAAVMFTRQILPTLVHLSHILLEKWIRGRSARWCFGLLPRAAAHGTSLQWVHPIGVQDAMLLQLRLLLQKKHGGLVYLSSILPMTHQSFQSTSDLLLYLASSPRNSPWDLGEQLQQTALGTSLFHSVIGDLSTSLATWHEEAQLHAQVPRTPAWGQAVIEEGGNVTTRPKPTKHQTGYIAGMPLNSNNNTKGRGSTNKSLKLVSLKSSSLKPSSLNLSPVSPPSSNLYPDSTIAS
jgi:hypothetical protein